MDILNSPIALQGDPAYAKRMAGTMIATGLANSAVPQSIFGEANGRAVQTLVRINDTSDRIEGFLSRSIGHCPPPSAASQEKAVRPVSSQAEELQTTYDRISNALCRLENLSQLLNQIA